MQAVLQIYDAKIDSRKRITLRNAKYDYYNVQELEDGRIIMEPRVLTPPFEISANTLSMMDSSIKKRRNKLLFTENIRINPLSDEFRSV